MLTAEKVAADKAAKEAARIAEKERKAAELAEAKRYPLEDLELLAELKAKALAAGMLSISCSQREALPVQIASLCLMRRHRCQYPHLVHICPRAWAAGVHTESVWLRRNSGADA